MTNKELRIKAVIDAARRFMNEKDKLSKPDQAWDDDESVTIVTSGKNLKELRKAIKAYDYEDTYR